MGSTERETLRQVLLDLARTDAPGDVKAARFQEFASKLQASSGGAWQAAYAQTSDGSHAFIGRSGELVVFTMDGRVFRGKVGSYRPTREGIELDYSKLMKL